MLERNHVLYLLAAIFTASTLLGCTSAPEDRRGQVDAGSGGEGGGGEGSGENGGSEAEPGDGDGEGDDDSGDDGGGNDNGGGDGDGGEGSECAVSHCAVERDEFPLNFDSEAPYQFGFDRPVDMEGETTEDGTRTWDLAETKSGEHTGELEVVDPDEAWFGDDFPDATYATELSYEDGQDELGVFKLTDDALLMLGVVEPDDGYCSLNLEYDEPIVILDFPLEEGKSWATSARASGTFPLPFGGCNYAWYHDETYDVRVDAQGELDTPYGTFPVMRIRTLLLQDQEWWYSDSLRSFTFVAPEFGVVARILSEEGEDEIEFDHAAEVMRFGDPES